ncbi:MULTISPECIES: hypothetical protein [unclassified Streptomyces]|uniref:hypothetical protein n=1 Tax=unclassified Streptomyces TaxID=2593676 RepID=UPI003321F492
MREASQDAFKCLHHALLVLDDEPLIALDRATGTGAWLWNGGTPVDIPVVDGARLLVPEPPPYQRSRPAGRFLPHMTGDLVLERLLAPEEAGRLLAGCVTKEPPGA